MLPMDVCVYMFMCMCTYERYLRYINEIYEWVREQARDWLTYVKELAHTIVQGGKSKICKVR